MPCSTLNNFNDDDDDDDDDKPVTCEEKNWTLTEFMYFKCTK